MIGRRFVGLTLAAGALFVVYWVASDLLDIRANDLALVRAVKQRDHAAARKAMARGADPNANAFIAQGAPMEAAVSNGDVSMVRFLVAAGGRVDKLVGGGHHQPPLGCAVHKEDAVMVRALLDMGADPYQKGCCYGMPEPLVVAVDKPGLLRLLVQHVGRLDGRSDRALLEAVDTNNVAAVRILLGAGANPNAGERRTGISALQKAVVFPEVRSLLVRAGAKPTPKNPRPATRTGTTALPV